MIEVRELVKRFGDFTALKKVSFKAREGEILGFLGPNGAGKTTTMRILTGYMPPTSGSAKIAGYDVFTDSLQVRREIGYLPETVPLYPDMTVRGYIDYIAELRQLPQRRKRIDEVLELVGMEARGKSLIRTISKGMRQRVGLAQALVHNPPVLILDEPTIGLDPHQVADLRTLIKQLGQKHTIMFSTHILSEAEQICDRVAIINRGEIMVVGTPAELRDQLQSNSRLYVRVRGKADKKAVIKILERINGVKAVELYQDGYALGSSKDIRPAVAAALLENNLELLELRPLAVTLEEIFMEYTSSTTAKS